MKSLMSRITSKLIGILSVGVREHHDIEISRRILLINALSFTGILVLIPMGIIGLIQENMGLFLADMTAAIFLLINTFYLRSSGAIGQAARLSAGFVALFYYYLFVSGGVENTAFVWSYTYPLIASFLLGSRQGTFASFTLLMFILAFLSLNALPEGFATYTLSFKIRFIASYIVVSAFAFTFERLREQTQSKLEVKNVELLHTVESLTVVEDRLRKAGEELEQRVRDRTAELTLSNEQLTNETEERRRSEQALRESEGKLNAMLRSISDRVSMIDGDLNIIWANETSKSLFGDHIVGKKCYEAYHRKTRPCDPYPCLTLRTFRDGTTYEEERQVIDREGHTLHLHTKTNVALRDENGTPVAVMEISRDITEWKKAETLRKELEEKLKRAEKMEAIGTLAGGVAHDLNNILSGIVSYPDLLLMQLPEESPLRSPLLTIQATGEKAAAIVQDMLTLSRRGIADFRVLDLNAVVSEYLESPEHEKVASYHSGVVVETRLDKGLLKILGSSVHLSKTLMNLVTNAAEAMPKGGTILLSTENRYVDRTMSDYDVVAEGEYVTLSISDTGVGIAPDDIDKIFEPFYTKKKMGRSGTGLGMAVVWGTVKDHKGYIDVKSTEGEGTLIKLYFPATRMESIADRPPPSIEQYRGKGESILVVDDVRIQREIASGMLKALGYSVQSVSSGEEAVERLKAEHIDLLILDMIMDPGIDGLDTYKRIIATHPGQKALIASGFSETDRVRETQKLGAGAYLKKPYTLEQLGMAVRAELDRKS